MNVVEELRKLDEMRQNGSLSEEDYARAKEALLREAETETAPMGRPAASDFNVNQWAMFIHISQLAGLIVPLAGLVLPIVLWQIKKNDYPEIDVHGKNVTNWIISLLIYGAVSFVLAFVIIGIFMLIALAIVNIVFAIIGALKANNGEVWKYPLAITFLK